jgi:hypothetical protein
MAIDPLARTLDVERIMDAQYYECRLAPSRDQVDYLLAFSRGAASALHRRLQAHSGAREPGQRARWRALMRLVEAWADGRSTISTRVPTMWLEFDDLSTVNLAGADAGRTIPSVSMCLVPGYRCDRPLALGDLQRDQATASEILDALGVPRTASLNAALSESFRQLPAGGRWIHLSVMLGRTPCAVKLYGVLPRHELLAYLQRIEWRGDLACVAAAMEGPYGRDLVGDELFVDLNLDTYHDPDRCTLGLAVAQQQRDRGLVPDPGRRQVLDRWAAAGLCGRERWEMLRDWSELVRRSAMGASAGVTRADVTAAFLDLKLVWDSGSGLSAKAYLGAHRPRWTLGLQDLPRLAQQGRFDSAHG